MDVFKMTVNSIDIVDAMGKNQSGQDKLVIADAIGRGVTSQDNDTVSVPNRSGSFLQNTRTPQRLIDVPIILRSDSFEDLRADVDKLSGLVTNDEEVAVTFNDEPYTYYAKLDGDTPLTETRTNAKGTLTFLCPDPRKYGPEQSETFTDSVTVENAGTADTAPVIRATAKESSTFIDIVKEDGEYMRVGDPGLLEQTPYERKTTILSDSGSSTTGWSTASFADNGYIAGEMIGTPRGFHPDSFGDAIDPYAWQGPGIVRGLSQPLGNFVMTAGIELLNVGNGTGMIEIYLLNANNETVAKIGLEDIWRGRSLVQGKMQLGPDDDDRHHDYREPPQWRGAWNDFEGIIKLFRDDYSGEKRIRPYFALVDGNGEHHYVSHRSYYLDNGEKYQDDVTQIQVVTRKWPSKTEADMYVKDVTVREYHTEPEGIPYIVEEGDVIEVDCSAEVIRINGEERKDLKYDFGSAYFDLLPGYNTLHTFPEGAYETEIRWRDANK